MLNKIKKNFFFGNYEYLKAKSIYYIVWGAKIYDCRFTTRLQSSTRDQILSDFQVSGLI